MTASAADPPSFLRALGSCPHPTLVQTAQCTLLRLDADLDAKLAFLHRPSQQAEEEAKLREEVEKAKLPDKSIVSLYELNQIYNRLVSTCSEDARIKKTLEVLNSFSEKRHVDPSNMLLGCGVAKAVMELGATQNNATKMDLSGHFLGSLPVPLGHNFTNLVSLDLSKNQLKDLPSSIGDLESLEVLDVQSNQLSSLPDAIGFLETLKVLNVSGNMLVALPDSLGGCMFLVMAEE